MRTRICILVDDLLRRVAHDPVTNFDAILLPSFKTNEKSSRTERKIRTKTGRSMLGLAHYRFKQKLAWMVRNFGKRLTICNEAYTSKTMSWTGRIISSLGSAKTISDDGMTIDRDINGARGIMLRTLYGYYDRFQGAHAEVAFIAD